MQGVVLEGDFLCFSEINIRQYHCDVLAFALVTPGYYETDFGGVGLVAEAFVFLNCLLETVLETYNKVLLLGKIKGLGYDISSIEANENPSRPEFARYIEVKSTKRITEPSFDNPAWMDSLNITTKEWVAAEQYGDFYNIYRVYFTKSKTIVVRIQNPYK